MTRREAILGALAVNALQGASAQHSANARPFRLAVCNETFRGASFAEACRLAAATGYTGLEVMPSTLSPDPARLSAAERAKARKAMREAGLTFTGLHAVVSAPAGLHLTTPDPSLRNRSWGCFRSMIDLAADLGPDSYLVLGSSKQRAAAPGESVSDAVARLRDGLAESAPLAQERGVMLLAEPLAPHLCNVLTSLEQAVRLVREINHPCVRAMFDTHNAVSETKPHGQLIREYASYIHHVHVNEVDGRHPGTGTYDFVDVLSALRSIRYGGWIALEVFHFEPSGEVVAREAATFLRRMEKSIPSR